MLWFASLDGRADSTAMVGIWSMGPVRYEDGRSRSRALSRQAAPVRTKFHPF